MLSYNEGTGISLKVKECALSIHKLILCCSKLEFYIHKPVRSVLQPAELHHVCMERAKKTGKVQYVQTDIHSKERTLTAEIFQMRNADCSVHCTVQYGSMTIQNLSLHCTRLVHTVMHLEKLTSPRKEFFFLAL